MSNVKLQDIALAAGVSMMTVSRVMNNDPKVGAKTREKVSAIAQEMRYQPNIAARYLASSKSYFIGLVCEDASASYVNKFLVGSLRRCRSVGYHMLLDETGSDLAKALDIVKHLVDVTNVDGLVLLPPISDRPDVIEYLKTVDTKVVRIAPDIELSASPYIYMDDYKAAFDITRHLILTGHTRIAHICGNKKQAVSAARLKGYQDALQAHDLTVCSRYIQPGDFNYKSGLHATHQLLALKRPPDAIFAANDEMALAAMSVAHMQGLKIPQQVSIAGFDDTELAKTVWPNLTTIKQPLEQMAALAIDILSQSQRVPKQEKALQGHVLDYQLIVRASTRNKPLR